MLIYMESYGSCSWRWSRSLGEKQPGRAGKAMGEQKEGPRQVGAGWVWRGGKGRWEIKERPRAQRQREEQMEKHWRRRMV